MFVEETTGLSLSTVILEKLKKLDVPFQDCRGQAYENGTNMKEKRRGIQARLLQKTPGQCVFLGGDTLNLVMTDAAKV